MTSRWSPLGRSAALLGLRAGARAGLKGLRYTCCVALALLTVGCARHYTTTGLVLSVTPPTTVTISHDAFPGFMDAMAMPFELRDRAARVPVASGDRVRLRLAVKGGRSYVDRLEVISAEPADAGLKRTPAVPALVRVGAPVPDFELTDQSNAPVSLASLRGKVVAVTFIYTRCPLPDYCPRMIENFRALARRFADRLNRDLVLLTVSFDPKYDTPATLAAYASANRAGGPGWRFLTGDPERIARVCEAFGIEYWAEEGLITHSLQTALIDRGGRLAATVEGKDFTPAQLGDLVDSVLSGR